MTEPHELLAESPVTALEGDPAADPADAEAAKKPQRPLYPRLLRLRHIAPNGWQRALLGEGALAVAVLLVLADLASAWALLVLPLAVAVVVKAHDVLAGALAGEEAEDSDQQNGAVPE
jgi:hypothetical protein